MGTLTYAYVYLFLRQRRWWVLLVCRAVSMFVKTYSPQTLIKTPSTWVSWGSKFEGSFLGKVIFTSYLCVCKFVCRLIICPLFGGPRPLPLLHLASSLMYKLQFSITLISLLFCADVNFLFLFFSPRPNFFPRSKIFV